MPDLRNSIILLFADVSLILHTPQAPRAGEAEGAVTILIPGAFNADGSPFKQTVEFDLDWGSQHRHRQYFDRAKLNQLIRDRVQQHQNISSAIAVTVDDVVINDSAFTRNGRFAPHDLDLGPALPNRYTMPSLGQALQGKASTGLLMNGADQHIGTLVAGEIALPHGSLSTWDGFQTVQGDSQPSAPQLSPSET